MREVCVSGSERSVYNAVLKELKIRLVYSVRVSDSSNMTGIKEGDKS